jgi:ParB family transcriptional regulator, chromosome partitioning protein
MTRKIKYKPVSKELKMMVKPKILSSTRQSIGLEEAVGEFYFLYTDTLIPFHNQARKDFNDKGLEELSASIKEYGIRQPLTVLKNGDKYEVVSGERRLRAAKNIGLEKVPCIILKENHNADAIALIENIHRKDLHPIELGIIYQKLLENKIFGNQNELASKISVSKGKVSEYLKYSAIPLYIQTFIIEQGIVSRDKLREVVKANEEGAIQKIEHIIGIKKTKQSNFSVLRVISKDGLMRFQKKGIQKLSITEKIELKKYLTNVIGEI